MKAEQLNSFLKNVKEGRLKEYGYCEPANLYMGAVHTSEEEDLQFLHSVKEHLIEVAPAADPWFTEPKVYRLTLRGNYKIQERETGSRWKPLSSFLQ